MHSLHDPNNRLLVHSYMSNMPNMKDMLMPTITFRQRNGLFKPPKNLFIIAGISNVTEYPILLKQEMTDISANDSIKLIPIRILRTGQIQIKGTEYWETASSEWVNLPV